MVIQFTFHYVSGQSHPTPKSHHMQKKREGHRKKYQGEAAPLKDTLNHSCPTVVGATSHKQITTINCTGQCTTSRT